MQEQGGRVYEKEVRKVGRVGGKRINENRKRAKRKRENKNRK